MISTIYPQIPSGETVFCVILATKLYFGPEIARRSWISGYLDADNGPKFLPFLAHSKFISAHFVPKLRWDPQCSLIGPLFAISAPSRVRPEIGMIWVRAIKILLFQVTQINFCCFKEKSKYKSPFNRKLFENQYIGPIKFSCETGVSRPGILVVRGVGYNLTLWQF